MGEHNDVTYDQLLKIWQFRREVFHQLSRALQMLMTDAAIDWHQHRDLRERLAKAEGELREVSEQIYAFELAAA
jgi:hypothetical protein